MLAEVAWEAWVVALGPQVSSAVLSQSSLCSGRPLGSRTPGPALGAATPGRFDRNPRADPMLNATVTITAGPWKGFMGLVTGVSETQVRVELHSVMRTVSVARNKAVPKKSMAGSAACFVTL